ncbi:hypothetical protein [Paractinoplanes rishiriensis]|uniref:hypothetical protein n=1 Tax=Paractinoplanes rishiriensis TaxID=1050105 RepID=UPI0019416CBB|nr:hypothetical protein [Actinoplanes rishiriensis]
MLAVVVGAFALPAPATALPDRFGFALWDGAAVSPTGTFPAATTIDNYAVGRYKVAFPNTAAHNKVAHVTAINTNGSCQVADWARPGGTEFVDVDCYNATGVRANAAFTVVFSSSHGSLPPSAGAFATVHSAASGTVLAQYNSTSAVNTVTRGGVGLYMVRLPGLLTSAFDEGSLQATAVNPRVAARCKIARWGIAGADQLANVLCFDTAGARADTQFTLTYQRRQAVYDGILPGRRFGYLWNPPPLGPHGTNLNARGGSNTVFSVGPGQSVVQFPLIGLGPDTVQVTAYGASGNYCGLQRFWVALTDVHVRVACFHPGGTPASTDEFFVAYASPT